MESVNDEKSKLYIVLKNNEEQYSLWPKSKKIPAGWEDTGAEGSKETCMAYVDREWVDMRPLSLRRRMENEGSVGE